MLNASKWRSARSTSPCPICGKPDWCQLAVDGRGAICRRIQSDKPQKSGGWFHHVNNGAAPTAADRPAPRPAPQPSIQELHLLAWSFSSAISPPWMQRFAQQLGLSAECLERLDVGFSVERRAWSFPMRDAAGHVLGIRMRAMSGRKFSITGGREGLFIPRDLHGDRLFVCEGPTDTAAMLDLGFDAIGRPSCMGGLPLIVDLLKARHRAGNGITRLVIVADGDTPGQRGAQQLAVTARLYCPIVQVITPPAGIKDARAWKRGGATAADVERAVWASPQRQLKVVSTLKGIGE
jgi:hypothetical protein